MKALLIGTGMVAQTHLNALRDNQADVTLVGVVGRNPERTNVVAASANAPGFTSLKDALTTSPDFAIIITPPDARTEIAQTLIAARIPVLMEKPIERTFTAARAIVADFTAANLPLGICFQHRTRDAAQSLRRQLRSGDLGDIIHVDIRVPWWRDQAYYDAPGRGTFARDGGGVMISQAIHTLDLALWLCGPVTSLQAHMRTSPLHQMEAEDIATALLSFASGASGLMSATTAAYPGGTESVRIITTCAHITLEGDSLIIDRINGDRTTTVPQSTGTGGGADPMAFTHAWHQAVIEDFANALRNKNQPLVSGSEALHVHAVIDAMTRAAKSGQIEQVPS